MGVHELLGELMTLVRTTEDTRGGERVREVQRVLAHIGPALAAWRAAGWGAGEYGRFGVLYVDDEPSSLKSFARHFGRTFRVLTAGNAVDALRVLKQGEGEIGVVVSDLRMPGCDGRWLLERLRQSEPGLVRILVSTFPTGTELAAAQEAANRGEIYTYLPLPWDPSLVEHVLKRALEFFALGRELDRLTSAFIRGPTASPT